MPPLRRLGHEARNAIQRYRKHHQTEIRMRQPAPILDSGADRPEPAEAATEIGSDDDLDRSFGVAAGALLAAVAVMALAAVFWPV